MTITLNLPPETEEALVAQAKARGIPLDAFLQVIIAKQVAATPVEQHPSHVLDEESDRVIDELFDAVRLPPGVGQGAMTRENWCP